MRQASIAPIKDRCNYHPHLTHKVTRTWENKSLARSYIISKWKKQDFSTGYFNVRAHTQ